MSTFGDKLKGNWNQVKGMLKQRWANLTDDDLLYEEGREDELIGKIQKRTGETKEQINRFIEGLKFN
ncbi:MAG: CsbD family protein [Leadbetterella sp.]|nr:CsbD family protein [Leadbetterella sp.]